MDKRGISDVVATVLIILVTVAAATIVWTTVIPLIKNSLSGNDACLNADVSIDSVSGYSCYDSKFKVSSVQVKTGVKSANITKIDFIVDLNGSSKTITKDFVANANAGKIFYLFLDDAQSSVEIAPVVKIDGEEKRCDATFKTKLNSCDLTSSSLLTGLAYYWKFNNSIADVNGIGSCNFNGGACPSITSGRNGRGNVANFDGLDDNILIRATSTSKTYTFSLWVNATYLSGNTYFLIDFPNGPGRFTLLFDDQKEVYAFIDLGGSKTFAGTPVIWAKWTHLVYVFSGLNAYLYINGIQSGSVIYSPTNLGGSPSRIGSSYSASPRQFFNGQIDEVMIFNRALLPSEVQELYNSQK